MKILDLQGKSIYKMSHGEFAKQTASRKTGSVDFFKKKNWIVCGGSPVKRLKMLQIGDYVYIKFSS